MTKLPFKAKILKFVSRGFFSYFYPSFLVMIKLINEQFNILTNINMILKQK
jgi:hypothetical protein